MNSLYYKRAIFQDQIVFAVTQKGTYYQIASYSIDDKQKDYYSCSIQCNYGPYHTWYSEDEWDCHGSHRRPILLEEEDLTNYLRGKESPNLKRILKEYEFDSDIKEFLVIHTVDGYAAYASGFSVIVTRVAAMWKSDMHFSMQDDAPITTIEKLKLDKNKSFIAGVSIKSPNGDNFLISLDNRYLHRTGFDKELYDKEKLAEDKERVEIMSMHDYELESGMFPAIECGVQIPQIEILPRLGILVWEYEEDGIRLKSAPQYYFIDLNDTANIKKEPEMFPDDELPF